MACKSGIGFGQRDGRDNRAWATPLSVWARCTVLILCCPGCWQIAASAPLVLVQLSDLHLSDYNASQCPFFGDRLNDLKLLSNSVLKALDPAAVLLTGDLVDGKAKQGQGRQSLTEWQDYRSVLDAFKKNVGLPEQALLDVRGNHDTFNVADRLGSKDFYSKFAALGRPNNTVSVFLNEVYEREPSSVSECPAAVLIGIDVSVKPGLAGASFFGQASAALLTDIDRALEAATTKLRAGGCSARIIAHGHFPLEVIAYPETHPWWLFARTSSRLPPHMQTLRRLLVHHGVSAYLNGHLHAAFGQRLHRLHRNAATGRYLAELETASWMADRRFRVVAVDGGHLAFTDLQLHTPSHRPPRAQNPKTQNPKPSRPPKLHSVDGGSFSVSAVHPTQQVEDSIVIITAPPDARYSPLQGLSSKSEQQTFDSVRALVLPVLPRQKQAKLEVTMTWICGDVRGNASMNAAPTETHVWEVKWPDVSCKTTASVQVVANDGSTSELRPIALRLFGDRMLPSEPHAPHALGLSWIDLLRGVVIHMDWPFWGYRMMLGTWALHFLGFLVLPWFAVDRGLPAAIAGFVKAAPRQLRPLLRSLLAPFIALLDMATLPRIWTPQVIYGAYLGVGPWAAAAFLEGEPLGLVFLGRLLFFRGGRPHWVQSVEPSIHITLHNAATLLPLTLWLATVASRWKRQAKKPSMWRALSPLQLAVLPLLLFLHSLVLRRHVYHPFGVWGLIFGPGMAWTLPLLLCLLWRLYSSPNRQQTTNKPISTAAAGNEAEAKFE